MLDLSRIPLRRQDFDTFQVSDWLDGLPVIGTPTAGGTMAGTANSGTGTIDVVAVQPGATYGSHEVTVTEIAGGLTRLTIARPDGTITGHGAVGLPVFGSGLTVQLTQGATAFVPGDAFAVSVVPQAADVTGGIFRLRAVATSGSAAISLSATTEDGTIINGGAGGVIAMRVLQPTMGRLPTGDYPYGISLLDPLTGLTVPAFYGTIYHRAVPYLTAV